MYNIFYIMKNGTIVDNNAIENAYFIYNGKYRWENEGEYIRFLDNLFRKKSILSYKRFTVEQLVNKGERIKAIKLYRDIHNCSLKEAKLAIDNMGGGGLINELFSASSTL